LRRLLRQAYLRKTLSAFFSLKSSGTVQMTLGIEIDEQQQKRDNINKAK
jgi:hypothetical protein